MDAKYCDHDQHVCICMYVSEYISKTRCPNFTKCSIHAACGYASVHLWPHWYTSGFVDDVMFLHDAGSKWGQHQWQSL